MFGDQEPEHASDLLVAGQARKHVAHGAAESVRFVRAVRVRPAPLNAECGTRSAESLVKNDSTEPNVLTADSADDADEIFYLN